MTWFVGVPVAVSDDAVPVDPGLIPINRGDRHLTLLFLGRLPDEAVMGLWRSLPAIDLPVAVHALRWERFGRSAIALAVSDVDAKVASAASVCHEAADRLIDVVPPSPFRPHVTLARVRRRAHPPTGDVLRGWPVPEGPLAVGALTLFRSRTGPDGDRYEVVVRRTGQPP